MVHGCFSSRCSFFEIPLTLSLSLILSAAGREKRFQRFHELKDGVNLNPLLAEQAVRVIGGGAGTHHLVLRVGGGDAPPRVSHRGGQSQPRELVIHPPPHVAEADARVARVSLRAPDVERRSSPPHAVNAT